MLYLEPLSRTGCICLGRPSQRPSCSLPASSGNVNRAPKLEAWTRSVAPTCSLSVAACGICVAYSRHAQRRHRQSSSRTRWRSGLSCRATANWTAGKLDVGPPANEAEDIKQLGKWCALVINLERREDRWRGMQKLLEVANANLLKNLVRVDAVDGKTIKLDSGLASMVLASTALQRARRAEELGLYTVVHDEQNKLLHFDDHMTPGAVACALSHHKALQALATHPTAEWALILEDDVSHVVPHVDRAIARLLRQLPKGWSAVFLGYHHEDAKPHRAALTAEDDPQEPTESDIAGVSAFEIHDHAWGLYSWMVSKEAAQELVERLFPINSQVDYAISSWLVRNRGGVFCVNPDELLFYSPTSEGGQDSDIQTMACEDKVADEYGDVHEYRKVLKPEEDLESYYDTDFYDWYLEEEEESEEALNGLDLGLGSPTSAASADEPDEQQVDQAT
eukprot:TRINITY_DN49283_c0_g2_i1.p1 TRINITY_DN49283_c0_g2~~TRINITY_DN49283_c0_g2_i1.p1  ORF type:complete len:450 (-),score=52.20 TRINITY_DN49283_c0_g2_i1:572-1921(-)